MNNAKTTDSRDRAIIRSRDHSAEKKGSELKNLSQFGNKHGVGVQDQRFLREARRWTSATLRLRRLRS